MTSRSMNIRSTTVPCVAPVAPAALLLAALALLPACSAPLTFAPASPGAFAASAPAPDAPPGDGGWTHRVAPYIWGAGLEGPVATLPPAPPADVDVSFSDILDNLDATLMVTGQSRHGDWGVFYDVVYVSLTADGSTPGPLFDGVELDMDMLIVTAGPSYRLLEGPDGELDVIAALRRYDVDNSLELDAGLLSSAKTSDHESWVDPMLGLHGARRVGEHWALSGWVFTEVGGESDRAWDAFAGARRDMGDGGALVLGYRHLEVDYDDDNGFLFDVELSGPVAGWVFTF